MMENIPQRVPYLVWREGRPRWVPGATLRNRGYRGIDLKDASGHWLPWDLAAEQAHHLNTKAKLDVETGIMPLHDASEILTSVARNNLLRKTSEDLTRFSRRDYVYIFGIDGRWAKIGYTTDLARRHRDIGAGLPVPLCAYLAAPGSLRDEQSLHLRFASLRVKNEWFRIGGELGSFLHECSANFRRESHAKSQSLTAIAVSF